MSHDTLAQLIADEAEAAEVAPSIDTSHYARNTHTPKDPAQVFSIRMPVNRLEEIRRLAERSHVSPSALMRRWILERLDRQAEQSSNALQSDGGALVQREDIVVLTVEQVVELVGSTSQRVAENVANGIRDAIEAAAKAAQETEPPAASAG